jgi:hypothetical protein
MACWFISTKFNLKTMNKETRTFIWGLVLMFVCGSGLAIHIIRLKNGIGYDWVEWTLFCGCLYGTITGGVRVFKTVD